MTDKNDISVDDALISLVEDQLWIYGVGLAARHWSPPGLTDFIWKHSHVFRSPWRPLCVFFTWQMPSGNHDAALLPPLIDLLLLLSVLIALWAHWLWPWHRDELLPLLYPKKSWKDLWEENFFFFSRILKSLISHRALTADREISKDQPSSLLYSIHLLFAAHLHIFRVSLSSATFHFFCCGD